MLYQEKFEPIANIGFSVQFWGGETNNYNRAGGNGAYGHYEVIDITPVPEYYLLPFLNMNTSPVISSLAPAQTTIYSGNDLELNDTQIGQWRFSVLTQGLTVNLQYGKGAAVVYKTKSQVGGVDSVLASTLYQMTEFFTFGKNYPYFFLQNTGSTALTSATIVFSGYIYDVKFVQGINDKMVILPMLGQIKG
jgi:hypothetical protein